MARIGCRECRGGMEEAAAALQAFVVEIGWLRRSLDLLLDVLVDGPGAGAQAADHACVPPMASGLLRMQCCRFCEKVLTVRVGTF